MMKTLLKIDNFCWSLTPGRFWPTFEWFVRHLMIMVNQHANVNLAADVRWWRWWLTVFDCFWCCEVSITSFCLILFPPWLFQLSKLSRDLELCNYHQHLFIMTVLEHIDFFLPRKCLFKYPSRSKSPWGHSVKENYCFRDKRADFFKIHFFSDFRSLNPILSLWNENSSGQKCVGRA